MHKVFPFIMIIMMLIPIGLLAQVLPPLPDCYYTYDEITTMLFDLESKYPNLAKVHQIGLSQEDRMPIYAMQITWDVNQSNERPSLLFVGQVHAEEVLGVQITMDNIQTLLSHSNSSPYINWIYYLDTWWIPTLNPEGHKVVTDGLDTSYRKNKRDNNLNGIFDYSPIVGSDIDGVDINRNFDFNWVHGDTLMQPGGNEVYDYYRGPAPMSESEIQALKNLADQKKFIYSICWHSSRTGNFSEKVYYSFNWKGVRPSPDLAFAESIAQGVANQIQKEGNGYYEYYPNNSRQGAFHDWMYKEYGTIQLLIECGTRNLQPDSLGMADTVRRCSNGVYWLLNRALNSSDLPSNSLLTGKVTDSVSGLPLEAEIIIPQRNAPWFTPRLSDRDTGRYYRPIGQGNYSLKVRKRGYWDKEFASVNVNNRSWTTKNVQLDPKEEAVMQGTVNSGNKALKAEILIRDFGAKKLEIEGDYLYNAFEGDYPIEVFSEGYFPYLGTISLEKGINQQHFYLSKAEEIFFENWENGTAAWEINGPWVLQNELSVSGKAITDSWGGKGLYAQNCDVFIKTKEALNLPTEGSLLLYFDSHLYTEWDYDPVTVEISEDGESWTELFRKSGRHDFWQKEYVSLDDYQGKSVFLRFRLRDESIASDLTDPGWTLDNIAIVAGESFVSESEVDYIPGIAALGTNYPNPFKEETKIRYSLGQPAEVELKVYNLKGQLVYAEKSGSKNAGDHELVFKGKDNKGKTLPGGVYFYRLKVGKYSKTRKMVIIK